MYLFFWVQFVITNVSMVFIAEIIMKKELNNAKKTFAILNKH